MSLKTRVYSVLLVSAAARFNESFAEILRDYPCAAPYTVGSISAAGQALARRSFDLVFINSPLPDDAGLRLAADTCRRSASAVLLLVPEDTRDEAADRVADYGVFTLPKPISRSTLLCGVGWMICMRERLRGLEKRSAPIVEEKMEDMRHVNRAKWLLISELKMSEPDAHRYIERQAMDRCVTKRLVADEIIKLYS